MLDVGIRDGAPNITLVFPEKIVPAAIEIRDNEVIQGAIERRTDSKNRVSFWMKEQSILEALVVDEQTIELRIDLRPVGLSVYSEEGALRVGGATLAGNVFLSCETALVLDFPVLDRPLAR